MKLMIEIPKEFEIDYKANKFSDFFGRAKVDIDDGILCGRYEKETIEMFEKAFKNATIVE